MNYTTNFNLRLPERNEQFNLDDWNNNTNSIDSAMQTNKTNISNNATNITSILTGLSTVNTSDTSSIYYKLMKLIYPVGSLYWSSKSTNPSSLFGGTWVQIKDRFVLACGNTYTSVGATGGASSVTLSVSNMPSHNHSFTPVGSISVTTNPTFTGSAVTSSENSSNPSYSWTGSHRHKLASYNSTTNSGSGATVGLDFNTQGYKAIGISGISGTSSNWGDNKFSYYDTSSANANKKLVENTSITVSGTTTGTHTHSVTASGTISGGAYKFTGTAGTTGSNGSGTSFSILPPYVVKYCFERTA